MIILKKKSEILRIKQFIEDFSLFRKQCYGIVWSVKTIYGIVWSEKNKSKRV